MKNIIWCRKNVLFHRTEQKITNYTWCRKNVQVALMYEKHTYLVQKKCAIPQNIAKRKKVQKKCANCPHIEKTYYGVEKMCSSIEHGKKNTKLSLVQKNVLFHRAWQKTKGVEKMCKQPQYIKMKNILWCRKNVPFL